MRIYKDSPFELSYMTWQVKPGRMSAALIVKATFDLVHDDVATVSDEQTPFIGPQAHDDAESLRFESEYAVLKPNAEWYLAGTAHSVGGPARVVPVKVRVGQSHKELAVWGDRVFQAGPLGRKPSEPRPFTSMPLRWERSYGGVGHAQNPVGCGAQGGDEERARRVPNLTDPRRPIVSASDRMAPVGLGPISSHWPVRTALMGTFDERWAETRWPYYPDDFDYRFYLSAPSDQRVDGYWRGDERVELKGLHPDISEVRTRLPGLAPRLFVERAQPRERGATPLELLDRAALERLGMPTLEPVRLVCDTIAIDADVGCAHLEWRGLIDVRDEELTDVERLFLVHEPIGTERAHAEYEAWLLRTLIEDTGELEIEQEERAALVEPSAWDDEPTSRAAEPPDTASLDLAHAMADLDAKLLAFLTEVEALTPQPEAPSVEAVREHYREQGVDPDELLPLLEPHVEVPTDEPPPSLRRLAAIVWSRHGGLFAGLDLSGAPYRNLDLRGADFTGAILTDADLRGADLRGASFDGAMLQRADLRRVDAREASFRDASLDEVNAVEARLSRAILDGATATKANLKRASLRKASLVGADLPACTLVEADVRAARLDGADLSSGWLSRADLRGASLDDTSLEGARARKANFEGCVMPDLRASDGADLRGSRFVDARMPGAQLQGARLDEARFDGADLDHADLSDAEARRASFVRARLREARLERADLRESCLLGADLFEAGLERADLRAADLRGAHLFSADVRDAHLEGAQLEHAILERTLREAG